MRRALGSSSLCFLLLLVPACGSSGSSRAGNDGGGGADGSGPDGPSHREGGEKSDGGAHKDGGNGGPEGGAGDTGGVDVGVSEASSGKDTGTSKDAGHLPDAGGDASNGATCSGVLAPVNVSSPTAKIGTGTAASCTEAALSTAITGGGTFTFNCGSVATTIAITKTIALNITNDTTLDGGGLITLDGGNDTQIFTFTGTNFQVTKTTVTLQHMHFTNARATGSDPFPAASSPCSQGFQDGGGGVIQIRDGVLHVIDSVFEGNHGAVPGPDIAGGAIYAIGSLDVTVVGSTFVSNDASNGGAIGSLFSDLTVLTSTFTGNKALGSGGNADNATCPVVGGQRETGSGGNGGAIVIDGGETFTVKMCGDTFSNNVGGSGALGGALFRTPDNAQQETDIDQCTFDGNTGAGAGAMYFHNSHLVITNSTLSNNSAAGSGAIQADGTILDLTNVTLFGNTATTSPGGTIALFGNSGTFTNVTFAKNSCQGAPGDGFGVDLFGGTALTINNTVFDSASQLDPNAPMACQNTNTGAHDFQWPKTHSVGSNPDTACVTGIDFVDPQIGALGPNGGPTQTAPPMAGSPVIGAGQACPSTDQRGKPRPASNCTAGAVELN